MKKQIYQNYTFILDSHKFTIRFVLYQTMHVVVPHVIPYTSLLHAHTVRVISTLKMSPGMSPFVPGKKLWL